MKDNKEILHKNVLTLYQPRSSLENQHPLSSWPCLGHISFENICLLLYIIISRALPALFHNPRNLTELRGYFENKHPVPSWPCLGDRQPAGALQADPDKTHQ